MIDWIEDWYNSQCDGSWEHEKGINIETLDNPGWNVEIDFNNTGTNREDIPWKLYEVSESNWVGFRIENNKFHSSGDPSKLNIILKIFKGIVEDELDKEGFIDSILSSK